MPKQDLVEILNFCPSLQKEEKLYNVTVERLISQLLDKGYLTDKIVIFEPHALPCGAEVTSIWRNSCNEVIIEVKEIKDEEEF